MNTLYGVFQRREEGLADSLAGMGAAVADCGADIAEWTERGIAFGARYRVARQACAESPLRFDREAGLAVAADARLDDRDTLCNTLGVPHPERAVISDGDLIIRAYARWGRDCPNHLLGDYAFAVWDAKQRLLFCARDHIGVRPFYYASTAEGFVFASEIEAVLAAPGVSDDLDEDTLAMHLTRVRFHWHRTFFRMVNHLPPGHTLTVEPPAAAHCPPRPERYWYPEQVPRVRLATDDAYAEELLDLTGRAVKDRLRGGPVGTHLSGGLDSSSVTVLAARELRRQNRRPPTAFSYLSPSERTVQHRYPECARIDAVCAQEGLRIIHCGTLSPRDVVDAFRRDVAYPRAGMIEESVMRHAVRQGRRVMLSSLGGDQGASFNGRGYYESLLLRGRWWKLAAECRAREEHLLRFLAHIVLALVHPRLPNRIARWRRGDWTPRPRDGHWLIHPAFARQAKPLPYRPLRDTGVRRTLLRRLRGGSLSGALKGPAASGARCGIEYRYPLLDRRLLEFALGLPAEQFRRGRWNRYVMRNAFRAVLPPEVCWNPSKADPARPEQGQNRIAEALPALRREVARCAETAERARYIDIPRLLERLDADPARRKRGFAPTSKALGILDF